MRATRQIWFVGLITALILTASCAGGGSPVSDHIQSKAGYYEIEPISFSFQNHGPTFNYVSSTARIFYSFHPADQSPVEKPLFVFFNGGPGCPTSSYFLSLNTAPYTLDPNRTGGEAIKENPTSWSKLGNLLYIDAPNTGFSYNLMENPGDAEQRAMEFDVQNFNPFIDAAQMARVALRFLGDHPELQDNPVILTGESYAGTRLSTMLNLLLYYPGYADGSKIYKDPALVTEIQKHFEAIHPGKTGTQFSPQQIAEQFGRQILVEPELTGQYQTEIETQLLNQPDSPVYTLAKSVGQEFVTCEQGATGLADQPCDPLLNAVAFFYLNGRDPYAFEYQIAWGKNVSTAVGNNLINTPVVSKLIGQDITTIPEIAPAARTQAYRFKENEELDLTFQPTDFVPPKVPTIPKGGMGWKDGKQASKEYAEQSGTLVETLGSLQPWDGYYADCSRPIFMAFFINEATRAGYPIHPEAPLFGEMFLQNLVWVDTLLTDAALDLSVYAASVPESFKRYDQIVDRVQIQHGETDQRDGYVEIFYKRGDLAGDPAPESRRMFFPHYGKSGHTVALFQPQDFFNDVKDWLEGKKK